jgi:flagellar hook-basal body complex protein FliE
MTISPLDALSALTQAQIPTSAAGVTPTTAAGAGLPMGDAGKIGESFNNLLPTSTPISEATPPIGSIASSSSGSPTTWGHMVQQMVMDVNNQQQNANALVSDVLKGGPTPIHQAMIATEEASLSFQFLTQVRNKVVDAYNQVMQMQV